MRNRNFRLIARHVALAVIIVLNACKDEDDDPPMGKDPDSAEKVSIDRFSETAGMLMVRTTENNLPNANMPINFDSGAPFITKGLGPGGEVVEYYNFDIQPVTPAPIYAFFTESGSAVSGQLNVVEAIPGDDEYNDFWQVMRVIVPDDYVANTVTSFADIQGAGYEVQATTTIVNCPIVPEGSTASKRLAGEEAGLTRGWYEDKIVFYFNFSEKALTTTSAGEVPLSPIYVTFAINPDQEGGGPASGFVTEMGSDQTHNVIATLPSSASYSPLWSVNPYDNADFDEVSDLPSAVSANVLAEGIAKVNCPVVSIGE